MENRFDKGKDAYKFSAILGCIIAALVLVGMVLFGYFYNQYHAKLSDEMGLKSAPYLLDQEVELGLTQLSQNVEAATLLTNQPQVGQKLNLTFNGLTDMETMEEIFNLLDANNLTATFYVSGAQAKLFPEVVASIVERGFELGNYTLYPTTDMEEIIGEELVYDICRAQEILVETSDIYPQKLRFYDTEYTEEVLKTAQACGFRMIEQPCSIVNSQSFASQEQTQNYVDSLNYGDIVAIKMTGYLEDSEYLGKGEDYSDDADWNVGQSVTQDPDPDPELTVEEEPDEALLQMVRWFVTAMVNSNYSASAEGLRTENAGALAVPVSRIKTTQRAVAYMFYGLGNEEELKHILASLAEIGATGTFYFSSRDLEEYPAQVQQIINAGHACGVALVPSVCSDFYATVYEITTVKDCLSESFQYDGVRTAMQTWSLPEEWVLEAVSALDMDIITGDTGLPKDDDESRRLDAQSIIDSVFGERAFELQRGQTVYIRMNHERISDDVLGDMITLMEDKRNIYSILPVDEIYYNTQYRYEYPLKDADILPEVKNAIYTGQLNVDLMDIATDYYIGNKFINTVQKLPSFSNEEIRALDIKGEIVNDDRAVFLTFDDWGTDSDITELLDVLEAYNVKATFFVVTRNVQNNPNLLRAIAEAGHDIASHTDNHYVLSNAPDNAGGKYTALTEEQLMELQADALLSYQKLQSIVGDIVNEQGRPVLTTTFRPPTMAVSREGMETIFDLGFSHIVNGSYTSQDYEAISSNSILYDIVNNISSGSIAIFHMSPEANYTPDALARYFEYNSNRDTSHQLTFARLSDKEYLTPSWSTVITDEEGVGLS